MKKVLLLLVLCSGLVYGQSPNGSYNYGGESERDRIAREHQRGGIYDNSSNSSSNNNWNGEIKLPDIWGAVAIDAKTFNSLGVSYNVLKGSDAKKMALESCAKRSSTCKVVALYKTNQCTAVATGVVKNTGEWVYAVETAETREKADKNALGVCSKKFNKLLRKAGVQEEYTCALWLSASCGLEPNYLNLNKQ